MTRGRQTDAGDGGLAPTRRTAARWGKALFALLLAACAEVEAPPPMEAVPCPAGAVADAAGDWLLGRWQNAFYRFEFERKKGALDWRVERSRHETQRWGMKGNMKGSGRVTATAGCRIKMEGRYDSSDVALHVGRALVFDFVWDGERALKGTLYGAGGEFVPFAVQRPATP